MAQKYKSKWTGLQADTAAGEVYNNIIVLL